MRLVLPSASFMILVPSRGFDWKRSKKEKSQCVQLTFLILVPSRGFDWKLLKEGLNENFNENDFSPLAGI